MSKKNAVENEKSWPRRPNGLTKNGTVSDAKTESPDQPKVLDKTKKKKTKDKGVNTDNAKGKKPAWQLL